MKKIGIVTNYFFTAYFYRYLDDVLITYNNHEITLDDIDNYLNNLKPDIKLVSESFGSRINFLDKSIVSHNDSSIYTDIFYITTDSKQHLNFNYHHLLHTKIAFPYNLSRRICTMVSDLEDRKSKLEELKEYQITCNYPKELIKDGIEKAVPINRADLLNPRPNLQ